MTAYLPPPRVVWHAIGGFFTTLATVVGSQYAQLAGTATSIGKGAWMVALSGAVGAAVVAGKAAWVEPVGTLTRHRRRRKQARDDIP